jgi:hypothetical protein
LIAEGFSVGFSNKCLRLTDSKTGKKFVCPSQVAMDLLRNILKEVEIIYLLVTIYFREKAENS